MRRWIILLLIIIIAIVAYNYVYQDHRDISTEESAFKMTAKELSQAFSNDYDNSKNIYLNKTIELKGVITEMDATSITLDDLVWCVFDLDVVNKLTINTQIEVKGRVIGYDDLLGQVKVDQCYIIK